MEILSVYFVFFILCVLAMKGVSICVVKTENPSKFYFHTPYLSPLTLKRNNASSLKTQIYLWLTYFVCTVVSISVSHLYLTGIDSPIAKAYLLLPSLYFSLELLGRTAALLFSTVTAKTVVDMHNAPWAATSLNDFWGKRWNLWVRDWILSLSKYFTKYGTKRALFFAFFLSGFFHEIMVAIPYYLLTSESVLGMMLFYFLIQFLGMQLERKFIKKQNIVLRILFTWIVIITPIPLFINKSILYFYGL